MPVGKKLAPKGFKYNSRSTLSFYQLLIYLKTKFLLKSICTALAHQLLLRQKGGNPGTALTTYPVLVNNIHDGHQFASMWPEGDEGNSADLHEALEHLGQHAGMEEWTELGENTPKAICRFRALRTFKRASRKNHGMVWVGKRPQRSPSPDPLSLAVGHAPLPPAAQRSIQPRPSPLPCTTCASASAPPQQTTFSCYLI